MNGKPNISVSIALQKKRREQDIFDEIYKAITKSLLWKTSQVPRAWLKEKGLSTENSGVGFNSGQLHYDRKEEYKDAMKSIGFLKYSRRNSNGVDGYKTFGNYGILFPLRNFKGKIVNFYAIQIGLEPEEHSLLNENGIYPGFPHEMTTQLFITTSILETATLLESRAIGNRDSVICILGGKILKQHQDAIARLTALKTIVWIETNDKNQQIMKDNINKLRQIVRNIPVKRVVLPDKENLNHIYLREGSMGVQKLLEEASEITEEMTEVESTPLPIEPKEPIQEENVVIFAPEAPSPASTIEDDLKKGEKQFIESIKGENSEEEDFDPENPTLQTIHEHKQRMHTMLNDYYVLGAIVQDLGSMRITLMVEELATGRKERTKIDLYEREHVILYAQQISDLYNQPAERIEADLLSLTNLLEQHREAQLEEAKNANKSKHHNSPLSAEKQSACVQFLSGQNLMKGIDELIEQAGVVGEESTRRLLFVIASTYKMSTPLHALVQGTSGSGKSHLINSIGDCFPPEDVISMTRVTSKSFYHYTKGELVDKLILIQDYDGLDEEAQFAFRELQSAGNISSSTTYKDRYGNLVSAVKTVRSHFASLLATTKAEVYYDNMSRSLITGVDEGDEQTKRIIVHQNKKLAGLIDTRDERKAKEFLQNCMRCIKPMEVVNTYADKVYLPFEAKMLRRLNSHYQACVKQITILHQYQRKRDNRGRLIAEPEDLQIACDIMFDAIMLKVDDLDASLRQFFDRMKAHIRKLSSNTKHNEYQFTQRDVRLTLNISKTQCFRYFEELELLEYIQRTGGYANRGFKYKIVFWDDMEKTRDRIKGDLKKQLVAVVPTGMEHQNPQKQG